MDEWLRRDWRGSFWASSQTRHTRGVAILIKEGLLEEVYRVEKDKKGRWVCVSLRIMGTNLMLISIYGPNSDDPICFLELLDILVENNYEVVLGGDFNVPPDNTLDKTYAGNSLRLPKVRRMIAQLKSDIGLVDIWRRRNPGRKEFTFYSHKHRQSSRIDYFFISNSLIEVTKDAVFLPRVVSDHNPVKMLVQMGPREKSTYRWSLNRDWLKDPLISEQISVSLRQYWELNEGSTSIGLAWDAMKAVVRGEYFQIASLSSDDVHGFSAR